MARKTISTSNRNALEDLWLSAQVVMEDLSDDGWDLDEPVIIDGVEYSFGGNFIEISAVGGTNTPVSDEDEDED